MALKKKTKKTNVRTRTELKVFEVFRSKHARAWQQGKEHLIANSLACLFTSATMGIVLGLPGLLFCFLEKKPRMQKNFCKDLQLGVINLF